MCKKAAKQPPVFVKTNIDSDVTDTEEDLTLSDLLNTVVADDIIFNDESEPQKMPKSG